MWASAQVPRGASSPAHPPGWGALPKASSFGSKYANSPGTNGYMCTVALMSFSGLSDLCEHPGGMGGAWRAAVLTARLSTGRFLPQSCWRVQSGPSIPCLLGRPFNWCELISWFKLLTPHHPGPCIRKTHVRSSGGCHEAWSGLLTSIRGGPPGLLAYWKAALENNLEGKVNSGILAHKCFQTVSQPLLLLISLCPHAVTSPLN